jgi:predicted amidohydrolase
MKVLVYQGQPTLGDLNANLTTVKETLDAASKMNADVAVFPELFLSGYNLGVQLFDVALNIDCPQIVRLRQFAKSVGVAVVVGFPEKDGRDLFNTAVAITADGNVVGKHRKVFCLAIARRKSFIPAMGLRPLRSRAVPAGWRFAMI